MCEPLQTGGACNPLTQSPRLSHQGVGKTGDQQTTRDEKNELDHIHPRHSRGSLIPAMKHDVVARSLYGVFRCNNYTALENWEITRQDATYTIAEGKISANGPVIFSRLTQRWAAC
jgi:hypothetical protein